MPAAAARVVFAIAIAAPFTSIAVDARAQEASAPEAAAAPIAGANDPKVEIFARGGYMSTPVGGGVTPFGLGGGGGLGLVVGPVFVGGSVVAYAGGSDDTGTKEHALLYGGETGVALKLSPAFSLRPFVGVGAATITHSIPNAATPTTTSALPPVGGASKVPIPDVITQATGVSAGGGGGGGGGGSGGSSGSGSGGSSSTTDVTTTSLYFEPGVLAMASIGSGAYVGLRLSALYFPSVSYGGSESAEMAHLLFAPRLGIRFLIVKPTSSRSRLPPRRSSRASPARRRRLLATATSDDGGGGGVDSGPLPTFDFTALDAEEFNGAWKTEGLVVLYAGQVVHEKYAAGWTADMRHITYSATKGIGAALVGIAIDQGLLKLTDSVCTYVPAPDAGGDANLCDVTIQHLLEMRSGKQWDEGYESATTSNVNPMLYGNESDMGLYVAEQPRAAAAGTAWLYSSGDSDLLARALRGALEAAGKTDMRAWASTVLFQPAGITSAVFEADRSGTLVFSSSCFLTPRDMAKLGQLWLDGGKANGTQVVSSGFIAYSVTPIAMLSTPSAIDAGPDIYGGSYGAQMWLNAATPTAPSSTWEYPHGTADMYSFEGHWGQRFTSCRRASSSSRAPATIAMPEFFPDAMIGAAIGAIDQAVPQ